MITLLVVDGVVFVSSSVPSVFPISCNPFFKLVIFFVFFSLLCSLFLVILLLELVLSSMSLSSIVFPPSCHLFSMSTF